MNIFIVADYSAPYRGNFIESIIKLEEKILKNNGKVIYSFPEKAKKISWIIEFSKKRVVYFHSNSVKNNFLKEHNHIRDNSKLYLYDYNAPTSHITCDEFYEYIETQKLIMYEKL